VTSSAFSDGVDRILHAIRPYGKSSSHFPRTLDPNATRIEPHETAHDWYVRLVTDYCNGNPDTNAVESNIAVFMALYWQGKKRTKLRGANFSTLVTSCELEEYFLEKPDQCEVVYFRLDFDYGTLGHPFSHPIPHFHSRGDLSPRFSFDVGDSGNVVMDYFDFLYRQFIPAKWKSWAESVWNKDYHESARDPQENPFRTIVAAFEESQFGVLREHASSIQHLKRILRAQKDKQFKWCMNPDDRALLQYPV